MQERNTMKVFAATYFQRNFFLQASFQRGTVYCLVTWASRTRIWPSAGCRTTSGTLEATPTKSPSSELALEECPHISTLCPQPQQVWERQNQSVLSTVSNYTSLNPSSGPITHESFISGLFQRAILQSGTALLFGYNIPPRESAISISKALNCTSEGSNEILACFMETSVEDMVKVPSSLAVSTNSSAPSFLLPSNTSKVSHEKDLGITISNDLKPSKHCSGVVMKANKLVGFRVQI